MPPEGFDRLMKPNVPDREKLAEQAMTYLRLTHQLAQAHVRKLAPVLVEQHGIDVRLYFIIKQIESGLVYPSEISKSVQLPNSVITRHLDQLAARGLLERSLDAEDSRRIRLTLTKEGERVVREATRTISGIVAMTLERLPPARREAFLAALEALVPTPE